jgi:hypothetical protein
MCHVFFRMEELEEAGRVEGGSARPGTILAGG